jgi:hypothetical protein
VYLPLFSKSRTRAKSPLHTDRESQGDSNLRPNRKATKTKAPYHLSQPLRVFSSTNLIVLKKLIVKETCHSLVMLIDSFPYFLMFVCTPV